MKIAVLAVGKIKDRRLRDLCDEYRERLGHHLPVEEMDVAKTSRGNASQVMKGEAASLESATPEGALRIAMTEEGKGLSSMDLARSMDRWMVEGRQDVVFYIGGANGLAPEFKRSCHRRWSLSELTFPHDVARMLLWEQLYRAMTIIRGEPYHK